VRDSGQVRRRGAARLLVPCLLVFGLFLMHGAPASAAGGCHGSAGAPPRMSAGHHGASPAGTAAVTAFHHPRPAGDAGASAVPGRSCVATPAHERVPLPAPALLAVTAVAVLLSAAGPSRPRRAAGRRRGPPTGGRQHLLQVCVART
jgi:hypothetical protein